MDPSGEQVAYGRRLAEGEEVRVELRQGDLADLAFLTPARIKGVEIEPAYHRVLEERIRRFGRVRATSILGAAEAHDYSDATAIYMYYPMRGERMNRLMQKIEADTRGRPLRVYSTGHASDALAELPWLEARGISPSKMAGFQRK